jgi:anti-sigma factor RsiW
MAHDTCRQLLSSLSAYVDHELSEELCTEIERHMADCQNCRIVIDTLKMTVDLYHAQAAPPEIPQDVHERLYHRLNLDEFLPK